jgi:hypothetical protein
VGVLADDGVGIHRPGDVAARAGLDDEALRPPGAEGHVAGEVGQAGQQGLVQLQGVDRAPVLGGRQAPRERDVHAAQGCLDVQAQEPAGAGLGVDDRDLQAGQVERGRRQQGRPRPLAEVEHEVVDVQVMLDDRAVAELGQAGRQQLDPGDVIGPGVGGDHIEQVGLDDEMPHQQLDRLRGHEAAQEP